MNRLLLIIFILCRMLSAIALAEMLYVPEAEKAKLSQPYRITFVNRYEQTPALPAILTDYIEKEIRAFLKLALGALAVLDKDEAWNRRALNILNHKGIGRVMPYDIPAACPYDRVFLGDFRKRANLYEIRLRECAPQDNRLSPVIHLTTLHPHKIGWLYATAVVENLSLEGYITEWAPPAGPGGTPEIKVSLRGSSLLPKDFIAPDARTIFRIVEVFTDEVEGKVLERRLLPWWFVQMEAGRFHLIGPDFKVRPSTDEYSVSYKIYRIRLHGGKQTLRLVSEKDRERRLPNYNVLASYGPDTDKYRSQVGLTNEDGEIAVEDKDGLPLFIRIEKQGVLLRKFVLLVEPHSPVLEIPVPEFHPKLPQLARRAQDLSEKILELHNRFNGALRKLADTLLKPAERQAQLTEAEKTRNALIAVRTEIESLERDAEREGVELGTALSDLKQEYAARTEKLPDLQDVVAKVTAAAQVATDAARSSQLEAEAMRLLSELKWEEAAAKYEEALRLAPPDQKPRIEQRLAAVKPQDATHAAARRFVRDELSLFDERAVCDRIAEIETHVKRLAEANDTLFLDAALKKINDLNSRLITTAGKILKEAEQDPTSVKEKAATAQKMIDVSKSLDILITKLSSK